MMPDYSFYIGFAYGFAGVVLVFLTWQSWRHYRASQNNTCDKKHD